MNFKYLIVCSVILFSCGGDDEPLKTDDDDQMYDETLQTENSTPIVNQSIDDIQITDDLKTYSLSLQEVFIDPDGDTLELTVSSGSPNILTASIKDEILKLTVINSGSCRISVKANDQKGGILIETFFCEILIQDNTPDGELAFRNPFSIDNYLKSEHFAVLWGSELTRQKVNPLLAILEENYIKFYEMGFLEPPTMASNKLNVYISGTGQVPENQEQAAVAGKDFQGHEMFIMNKAILNSQESTQQVTAHEYFHSIQYAYHLDRGIFPQVPWLGESSATWASSKIWPENLSNYTQALPSYAYYPQYPIDDYTLNGGDGDRYLLSGHHYGTFLFYDHLESTYSNDDFIKEFFEYIKEHFDDISNKNAFEVLKSFVLENYSDDLTNTFHEFAVKNVTWNGYDKSVEVFENAMQNFSNAKNQRIAAEQYTIDNSWHEVSDEIKPRRWGSNYIKLSGDLDEIIDVSFDGNLLGCSNSVANWKASILLIHENESTHITLELENSEIYEFPVETNNAQEVWLIISNTPTSENNDETFAYRYQFAKSGLSHALQTEDVNCN